LLVKPLRLTLLVPTTNSISDARSGQVVDDRIRPALESGAAVGSKKPVLLVVDEIDGATGGGDNVGLRRTMFVKFVAMLKTLPAF
jgi:hypothetical protein